VAPRRRDLPLRLLIVEDSEPDAALIEHEIRRGGFDVRATRVTTAAEMRVQLRGSDWDFVISDYELPGSGGDETLAVLREEGLDIPFLLVSGTVGEELAAAVMQAGASDYLEKGSLARLVPVIVRELAEAERRREARSGANERASVYEALNRFAVGAAGVVDAPQIAQLAVDQATFLAGADGAILRWYDGECDVLRFLASKGVTWELRQEIDPGEMGDSFRSRQPIIQNRYDRYEQASPKAIAAGVTALAVIPLSVRDRPVGALAVFSLGDHKFSAADLVVLALLGAQAAPAIEAARLHLELKLSDERFKTAFQFAPAGIAISTPDGRYLAVSPALCRMLGYSEVELLSMRYFDVTHPDDIALGWERSRALEAGELDTFQVTKRYLHRDGHVVWAELSVSAVRDGSGAVLQLISQIQDITERKQAEDSLAESLSLLEHAQEIGDIGTFIAWRSPEKQGQDEWSKACLRIFGCDELTFDGTPEAFWRRVHPEDVDMVRASQAAAETAGTIYDLRHRIIRPDGEVRWVHERARVEKDPDGTPVRYVGVTRDVTEEKLAEDSLRASEARNAAVIEAAVDCLIVVDATGRVTEFNPAAERTFGYKRAEVLGRDLPKLVVPARFRNAHREALRLNLETGDDRYLGRRLEIVLRRADGRELPAEISISRFEVDGAPSFSCSVRDLSDRDQLLQSRERLAEVVHSAPVILFAFDSEGRVTLAEGRTIAELGVKPGTAVGANIFELIAEMPEVAEHVRRGLAGESFVGPIHIESLDLWLEARYDPILDERGKVVGMSGLATDISDRVKGAAAREESDAKSRLVAVVNHEVRTPLNSILGFTELLMNERAGPLNEKQMRYAGNVDAAGRHLLALINDSLDLSRMAAGKMDLDIVDLELAPVLDLAAGQVQPLVDSRGLEIRVDAGGRLRVRGDRRRLLQVLWNLLSNAIRHTPTGGVITISARAAGEVVEISVSDTGIGIAAAEQERIFEEYAQVEGQADGTGLGLPVSRRLAKLMKGDIRVASEVGAGSTFTITLPRSDTSPA
jgi:PAS domain S-box-containing protein